jgi:uncharacterized membrane protein YphA (DoxX/SURF4 family)
MHWQRGKLNIVDVTKLRIPPLGGGMRNFVLKPGVVCLLGLALSMALPALASAAGTGHVKWFTRFSFADRPNTLGEVLSPLVFGLTVLSMLVIAALVPLDAWLQRSGLFRSLEKWLEARKDSSNVVMRVGMGATLLLSWQADSLLAPDLKISAFGAAGPALGWAQFFLALLLLLQKTTPIAGAGVGVLYLICVAVFGPFYMLDYLHFAGIAVYLLLSAVETLRIRAIRLPVLYATVGFALAWLGMEKLVYPDWGLYVLDQNPRLSLGLPVDFFLRSAAFVEISLGYLLIICLFERPMALVITLVFFSTTLVFGKIEVIGHTAVHAALIVFLLNGPGTVYRAPITFHDRKPLRAAFGAVNFLLTAGVILALYSGGAWAAYQRAIAAMPTRAVAHAPALRVWREGDTLRMSTDAQHAQALVFIDGAYAGAFADGRFALREHPEPRRIAIALADEHGHVLTHNGAPVAIYRWFAEPG